MMQPMGGQSLPMDDGKIFVGGLHPSTSQDSLKRYFLSFGEVVDCVLMLDNVTKRSRGFGFVTFKDTTSVQAVMSSKSHILDGKQIDPKRAVPKGPGQSMLLQKMGMAQPGRNRNPHLKIFVGGISQTTSEEHVKQYFSAFGTVVDVKMPTDKKTGNHRGFAFVGFDSPQAPQKAQSTVFHQINGKTVEVKSLDENALRYNAAVPPINGQYFGGHGAEGYGQVGASYGPGPAAGYPYQGMGQQPSAYAQAPGAAAPPAYAGYAYGAHNAYGGMAAGGAASAPAGYATSGAAPGALGQGRVDSASVSTADYGSYSTMYGFGNYAQEASSYGPARTYTAANDIGSYAGTMAAGAYGADASGTYGANAAAAAAAAVAQNQSASLQTQVYQDTGFGRGGTSARGFHPYGR